MQSVFPEEKSHVDDYDDEGSSPAGKETHSGLLYETQVTQEIVFVGAQAHLYKDTEG